MSTWSSPASAGFDPERAYGRLRLLHLVEKIRAQVPEASVSEVIAGELGYYSVAVSFANGLSLLVSTDPDLPEALFEVVRFVSSEGAQQLPFETRAGFGSFYCDKLPSQSAVDLLIRYRGVPPFRTSDHAPLS